MLRVSFSSVLSSMHKSRNCLVSISVCTSQLTPYTSATMEVFSRSYSLISSSTVISTPISRSSPSESSLIEISSCPISYDTSAIMPSLLFWHSTLPLKGIIVSYQFTLSVASSRYTIKILISPVMPIFSSIGRKLILLISAFFQSVTPMSGIPAGRCVSSWMRSRSLFLTMVSRKSRLFFLYSSRDSRFFPLSPFPVWSSSTHSSSEMLSSTLGSREITDWMLSFLELMICTRKSSRFVLQITLSCPSSLSRYISSINGTSPSMPASVLSSPSVRYKI